MANFFLREKSPDLWAEKEFEYLNIADEFLIKFLVSAASSRIFYYDSVDSIFFEVIVITTIKMFNWYVFSVILFFQTSDRLLYLMRYC